jgi:hypothetical protein
MKPVVVARDGCENADEAAYAGSVREALRAVNGDASAHTITSYKEVLDVCLEVERMFARRGLPKSRRGPCRAAYRPAGPAAASYRFRVVTTSITLERTKGGVWKLVEAARSPASPRQRRHLSVTISAEMCCEIAQRAIEPFSVGDASPSSVVVAEPGGTARHKPWFRITVPAGEHSREALNRWCHEALADGFWIDAGRGHMHGWFENQADAALFRMFYDPGG